MPRAYAVVTDTGVAIGAEHAPSCPHLVEQHNDQAYCQRSRESAGVAEHDVELAFDAATSAIEPWWRRAWTWLRCTHTWSHDGSMHHHFEGGYCFLWIELTVPREGLREAAAAAARQYLASRGYALTDTRLCS